MKARACITKKSLEFRLRVFDPYAVRPGQEAVCREITCSDLWISCIRLNTRVEYQPVFFF
jgi:hypothetical protein